MAKKQQQSTVSAGNDDQPFTPAAEVVQPKPLFAKRTVDEEENESLETTSSSENVEEETDSDSEHEPPLKLNSKPKSSDAPGSSGTKRLSYNDTNQAKKKQKTTTASAFDAKKQFQRVFTKKDEVEILKGLISFIAETGEEYHTPKHLTEFHRRVENSISFRVKRSQLKDKVCRLKKKFENKAKSLKNSKSPTFSKSIDQTIFKLSNKIWGGKASIVEAEETKKDCLSVDDMKDRLDLIGQSKRVKFERRWRKLRVAELKVLEMRAELVEEEITVILDAMQLSLSRS